jgi:hypothetical protein
MLGFFLFFGTTLTSFADEMKIVSIRSRFADTNTFRVLPDITFLTGDAMRSIIDLAISSAYAVEDPVVFFSKLFQGLFLLFNFCFEMTLR